MSCHTFLTRPCATGVIASPQLDASHFSARFDSSSGRFDARLNLAPGSPNRVSLQIAAQATLPGGCRRISIHPKFSIGHFTFVNVIPGPGYAEAACGVDIAAIRRKPCGSESVLPLSSAKLTSAWTKFVTPTGVSRLTPEKPISSQPESVEVPEGTEDGEVWMASFIPWVETAATGFHLSLATAQVFGTTHGFRISAS